MKPPSSRSCSKVRYINITSPPYGREKRNLLPSVKGSNRHHLGVPPGHKPVYILYKMISNVKICVEKIKKSLTRICFCDTIRTEEHRQRLLPICD